MALLWGVAVETGQAAEASKEALVLDDALKEMGASLESLQISPVDCFGLPGLLTPMRAPTRLFRSNDLLKLKLTADFRTLNSGDDKEKKFPGRMLFKHEGGESIEIGVDFSVRGNYKRSRCARFKPIRIVLDKNNTKNTPFQGVGKELKLATHCDGLGEVSNSSEQVLRLLREYTAYKLLNAMGLMSFKVRLAEVEYFDSSGNRIAKAAAFLLEPKDDMAKRYGMKNLKQDRKGYSEVGAPLKELELIQFFLAQKYLGNGDYYVNGSHNGTKLVAADTKMSRAIVPYDFDLASLVDQNRVPNEPGSIYQLFKGNLRSVSHLYKFDRSLSDEDRMKNSVSIARRILAHEADANKVLDQSPLNGVPGAVDIMRKNNQVFYEDIKRFLSEVDGMAAAGSPSTP